MSTVYFHDLNKSVDIPDDYNEDAINDIHDSLAKDISNGVQQPDSANNMLQKAASGMQGNGSFLDKALGGIAQTTEAGMTGSVPQSLVNSNPEFQQARNESVGLNAQVGNAGMAGIPGFLMSKFGAKLPQSSNPIANMAGNIVGGMTGIPGMASNALAGGIANPLLRGAVRGGSFGAAMPGNIGQRTAMGVGGAITGAPLEVAVSLVGKIGKIFGSKKALQSAIGEQNAIESEIENAKEAKSGLQENLASESLNASENAKNAIKGTVRSNTEQYGSDLANIEESLKDMPASKTEYIKQVINPTLQEAEELGLPEDSPTLSRLRGLANKWTPSEPVPQEPITTQDMIMGTQTHTPPPIQEPFNDSLTINDLKNLRGSMIKTMGGAIKTGAQAYQPEDVASSIYLKNHGEYLGSKSDELSSLSQEYRPYAQAKKWAYKTFKPGNPDEVQRGANVIRKIASGNYNQDDLNYLETLEKGSGRFKGTGSLRGNTPTIASQISDIDSKIESLRTSKGNILQKMPQLNHYAQIRSDIIRWGLGGLGAAGGGELGYILGRGAGAALSHKEE